MRLGAALALLLALGAAACAHAPLPETSHLAWQSPPAVTDSTLALWRFDETTGLAMLDAGPQRADGVYGIDTRTTFGRFRNARQFAPSINSFGLVRGERVPALGDEWSIEAWVDPAQLGAVECNVIAARWTDQPLEQGWMFGLVGFNRATVAGAPPRPDLFDPLIGRRDPGLVIFAFQPQDAGNTQVFESTVAVDANRWTHIAVTHDGHELRIYLDGRLDAQFANAQRVRAVATPLVIGNVIDPRWLTESQGPLRVPDDTAQFPFYAFEGAIDELRISSTALRSGHP